MRPNTSIILLAVMVAVSSPRCQLKANTALFPILALIIVTPPSPLTAAVLSIDFDESTFLFEHFNIMIGAVGAVVFILMLLAFRSIVVAIKAVLSIAITQLIVRQMSMSLIAACHPFPLNPLSLRFDYTCAVVP